MSAIIRKEKERVDCISDISNKMRKDFPFADSFLYEETCKAIENGEPCEKFLKKISKPFKKIKPQQQPHHPMFKGVKPCYLYSEQLWRECFLLHLKQSLPGNEESATKFADACVNSYLARFENPTTTPNQ